MSTHSSSEPERPAVSNHEIGDDLPHVLVVDDDDGIRRLLARYLRENGLAVSVARNAEEADRVMDALSFDALVLDVMMPGEDGVSLTRRLRALSDVPILMLTARGQADDRIEGLEAGADDYLPKPFEPRELLLRLRGLLSRRPRAARAEELQFGPNVFAPRRGELKRDGEPVRLTGAELTLLRTLSAKPGAAISRAALAEKTGGFDRSVDVQVTRLRRKIEDDPRAPLYLQTVRGVGYALIVD
ncbi:response regulator [Parvularcula oceani]|uniref:response regulator n=1 Tax=Parvularcula oceani TaxID=1247963 RepID=UPI000AA38AF7|nr:response regulator [Parvularcula oceani]